VARRADRAGGPRRGSGGAAVVRSGVGSRRRARRVAVPRAVGDRARAHRRARRATFARPGGVHERRFLRDRAAGRAGRVAGRGDDSRRGRRCARAGGRVRIRARPAAAAVPRRQHLARRLARAARRNRVPACRRGLAGLSGGLRAQRDRPLRAGARAHRPGRRGTIPAQAHDNRHPPARDPRPPGRGPDSRRP
jgi:hypothetical protein